MDPAAASLVEEPAVAAAVAYIADSGLAEAALAFFELVAAVAFASVDAVAVAAEETSAAAAAAAAAVVVAAVAVLLVPGAVVAAVAVLPAMAQTLSGDIDRADQ